MKKIRQLWLMDSQMKRYGLNGQSGIYAGNLTGLGFALSPKFADLSHGFFASVADANDPQGIPSMTLYFVRNPYETYQELVNWLAAANNQITLVYNPTGAQEYMMDITVSSLQKGELTEAGLLECPCAFFSRSPWYRPEPVSITMESVSADDSKRYDYTYGSELMYGDDAAASLSTVIYSSGHIPGAIDLKYHGMVTNPRIRLVGTVTGKTYGLCSCQTVLQATDTMDYSSRHNDSHLRKISAAGAVTDLLDVLDLSSEPFFHLPTGEPCQLFFEADSTIVGFAELTVYYFYRSV